MQTIRITWLPSQEGAAVIESQLGAALAKRAGVGVWGRSLWWLGVVSFVFSAAFLIEAAKAASPLVESNLSGSFVFAGLGIIALKLLKKIAKNRIRNELHLINAGHNVTLTSVNDTVHVDFKFGTYRFPLTDLVSKTIVKNYYCLIFTSGGVVIPCDAIDSGEMKGLFESFWNNLAPNTKGT